MKLISNYLSATLLIGILTVGAVNCQTVLESGKLIPVYTGAVLKTEFDPSDSKMCCSFITSDSFDKVVGFYESVLKIKPLDPNALATQLPFLKLQVDAMLKQMPPEMKLRYFVLNVFEFQGQKGAELFEVVYTGRGTVEFEIIPSQFIEKDAHFEAEWNGGSEQSGESEYVDPEILLAAFPSAGPEGFERGEQNVDATPGNPPFVDVSFSKLIKKGKGGEDDSGTRYASVSISISDNHGATEYAREMITVQRDIDKAVKVKGKYDGVESVEKNEYGCVGASKRFIVNNRFLVELQGMDMCDLTIINQLIDSMNLDALPK